MQLSIWTQFEFPSEMMLTVCASRCAEFGRETRQRSNTSKIPWMAELHSNAFWSFPNSVTLYRPNRLHSTTLFYDSILIECWIQASLCWVNTVQQWLLTSKRFTNAGKQRVHMGIQSLYYSVLDQWQQSGKQQFVNFTRYHPDPIHRLTSPFRPEISLAARLAIKAIEFPNWLEFSSVKWRGLKMKQIAGPSWDSLT